MAEFDHSCPLLMPEPQQRLRARGLRRQKDFQNCFESAADSLRKVYELMLGAVSQSEQQAVETASRQVTSIARQRIIELAETEAEEGVCAFAEGLLASENKSRVNAIWLREYAAQLISEIRAALGSSTMFQEEPLAPWGYDSIAQKAIKSCEQKIAERTEIADREKCDEWDSEEDTPQHWSHVVLAWEGYKATQGTKRDLDDCIPESVMRAILSQPYAADSVDVTWEQIQEACAELCRHYGSVKLIPNEDRRAPDPQPDPVASAGFWKEREDEFRKHATGENSGLYAEWLYAEGNWLLLTGPGVKPATQRTERVFKSLAQEACKGLARSNGKEPWIDWLDMMRRANYSKSSTAGSQTMTEREFERRRKSGEHVLAGGVIRFCCGPKQQHFGGNVVSPTSNDIDGIDVRRRWEWVDETIANVLEASADFCLELRSKCDHHTIPAQEESPACSPGAVSDEQPLGANPFPQDHAAYAVFSEATWRAKESIAKLKLEFIRTCGASFVQTAVTFRLRWLAACAFEAISVVGNAATAQWYEQWIDDRARLLLEDTITRFEIKDPKADPSAPLPFSPKELKVAENRLTIELLSMVAHYKGVAASRAIQAIGMQRDSDAQQLSGLNSSDGAADVSAQLASNSSADAQHLKPGPKPDLQTAMRVAEIVWNIAADGKWRSRLDEICDTLDEAKIRSPKKWRGRTPPWRCWSDCDDKPILTKMIEYRLRQAKQQEKPAPETLA